VPKDWSAYTKDADKSSIYIEDDFRAAAYQLLTQQVLYENDRMDSVAYQLINKNRSPFREAFDLFGMDLYFDTDYRYCAAIPRLGRRTQMTLAETLLMLVLRKIHHEQTTHGDAINGAATISIDELLEIYRAETGGRDLPRQPGELTALVDSMKRYGIVRKVPTPPGDPQPFAIEIRPAIEKLVNENMLTRMSAYQNAQVQALATPVEEDTEEGASDETA
jgi:hypothetical protein